MPRCRASAARPLSASTCPRRARPLPTGGWSPWPPRVRASWQLVPRSVFSTVSSPQALKRAVCFLAVTGKIKLALTAGKANPAPPVGPALGSKVRNTLGRQLSAFSDARQAANEAVATRGRVMMGTHASQRSRRARPPGCEHHGFLQGVQRADVENGGRDYPRRDHRLRGQSRGGTVVPAGREGLTCLTPPVCFSTDTRPSCHTSPLCLPFLPPVLPCPALGARHPTLATPRRVLFTRRRRRRLLDPQDRSFTFVLKTPPASVLLLKAAKVEKGSGKPNKEKVGKVTKAQVKVRLRWIKPAQALRARGQGAHDADQLLVFWRGQLGRRQRWQRCGASAQHARLTAARRPTPFHPPSSSPSAGNRRQKAARHQLQQAGVGHAHDRGHRPQHGHRRRRLSN